MMTTTIRDKKPIRLLRLLMLVPVLVAGAGGAWGETVTRNYTATYGSKTGVAEAVMPMVKITYGSGTWVSYAYTYNAPRGVSYTRDSQIDGGAPRNGATILTFTESTRPAIPDNGSYVMLEPLVNGTILLDYYINNDPTAYCLLRVSGSTIEDYRYIGASGSNAGSTLTFAAEAGKKYYFFANGVTTKFLGFSFQYERERLWDVAAMISENSIANNTPYSSFPRSGSSDDYRYPTNTGKISLAEGSGYLDGLAFHTDSWRILSTTAPVNSIQNTAAASRMLGIKGVAQGEKLIVQSSEDLNTANYSGNTNAALAFTQNGNYYVGTIPSLSTSNMGFFVNQSGGISSIELVAALPHFSPAYTSYRLGSASGFVQPTLYNGAGSVVANSSVTYGSSNPSVVKVSADGHSYIPVGVGTATISVTVGGKTATLEVNVTSPDLAWTSTKAVTVSLLDADNNNHVDDLLPTLYNATGNTISYTPNTQGENAAWFATSEWESPWGATLYGKPRIRKPGTVTLTATDATDGTVNTSFSLTITDPGLTTGRYIAASNSYEFPTTGRLVAGATISSVAGVTMQYGNGTDLPVVVNSGGKTVVKLIDGNGFSHPNLNGGVIPIGGTYYKFVAAESGTLYVSGVFSTPKLYKSDNTEIPLTADGSDYKADLTAGNTYYLYNNGSNQPMLHSFRYESQVDITVGSSQWKFRNNTFADEIGDKGDGYWTYSSNNTSVLSFDDDTYGNATKTGVATIKGVGYATVTAEKGVYSYTYVVKVKKDDWDDLSVSTEGITITGSHSNVTGGIHPTGVPFTMSVPAIAGQTFKFVAGKTGSGGYNHNIYLSNTSTDSYRLNNQNTDNTWTSTVDIGAYNVELSINDAADDGARAISGGTYIKNIHTNFPQNSISFGSATYKVGYLPGSAQTGQLATTANSLYNVLYVSSNKSVAEVHPFTGRITVKDGSAGNETVTITAYNLGEVGKYNGNSTAATYTLHIGAASEFQQAVNVEDLMYMPGRTAAGGGLARTIPYLDITYGDNDAAISSGTSAVKLFHKGSNNGSLTITPRYNSSTKLTMNSLTLTFSEAPKAGDQLAINGTPVTLTGATTQEFTAFTTGEAITVAYASIGNGVSIRAFQVGGTATSGTAAELLTATKATPTLAYSPSSYKVAVGYTADAVVPTTDDTGEGFKNLRGISYALTDANSHFTLSGDKLTAVSATGSDAAATLTASFAETYLFNAASSVTCSFTAIESEMTPAVAVSNKLLTYSTSDINAFAFTNEALTLSATIGGTAPTGYTVRYTVSDDDLAVVNSDGSVSTLDRQGLVTITANFIPVDPTTNPILTATTNVYVLSGQWDFTTITNTVTNTMQSAPTGWTDDPWHKSGSSNGSTRDTKDYQPILMDTGDPLPQSIALQTAYAVRMFNGGAIHLYGHNHTAYTASNGDVGGVLRVPVRRGMTVTITAYNNTGENEEITLSGLNNLENTDEATTFFVNTGSTTESFIANKDGYIDIINSTANVNLFIQSVNVSNDIVFQYGNETYVKAGTSPFVNPVLNGGTSTLEYTYRNVIKNAGAAGIASAVNSTTGSVTFGAGYGIFEVTAAATGGQLNGQSSSYEATVIGFTLSNQSEDIPSTGPKEVDLKTCLTIETGNTFAEDNSDAAIAEETSIKENVRFSIVSSTNTAMLSGTTLTMEGAGTVTLRATLGAISETFTYTLAGASLDVANAVISREKIYDESTSKYIYKYPASYTITLNTAETGVTAYDFDVDKMKGAIMGTIKSKGKDTALTFEESDKTLTISGFSADAFTSDLELGGVIPIYASYTYNGNSYQIEGTLTVAYAQHTWNFEHNLISGDNTAAGVAAHINDGLAKWYSATPSTKEGKWTSTATFDMPTDAGDDVFATGTADDNHTNSHLENHDWKFVRKMKDAHRESAIIYYYNHDVNGQNALVIPETQGLVIHSSKNAQQMGVEMASERVKRAGDDYTAGWGKPLFYTRTGTSGTDPGYTYTQITDDTNIIFNAETGALDNEGNFLGNSTQTYYASNIMLLNGGKITIPGLQKGQWVEVRWTRHQDDLGERLRMTNLSDAEGTAITSTYKIGNCFYNLPYSTSTYMFQATEAGDVTFEVTDNVYISIQQIELHDPDWDYTSNFVEKLNGFVNDIDKDGEGKFYTDDKYKNEGVLTWGALTTTTAPQVKWQYVWDDQGSHTITILPKALQNAPNAPQTWTFTMDDMLKRSGAVMEATGSMDQPATITYNGGWGKVKVTMTSWTQNMKYVANKKSWTITFGQAPKQTYPYTWDFTKFFANTPTSLGNDITWDGDKYTGDADNIFIAVYNNHSSSNYGATGWTNSYDTPDYQSYYVEGAQLVSYNLRGTNNGVLRETEGLGFKLDTNGNGKPNNNMLLLNMVKTVGASGKSGASRQTWETGTDHTTTSHLTIATGGRMIVPRPNDAVNYGDYYIYIRSSVAPSAFTNVTDCSSDAEVPTGVYKYQFNANANAEFTFTNDSGDPDTKLNANLGDDNGQSRKYTDIYAVAVTKDFKDFKRLNGKGWATESRDYAVDYTLDSLLTTLPVWAHPIIARSSNPMYSDNKTKTTVRLMDRGYVVPANQGLVLKQVTSSPGSDGSTYSVPLFAPAVTTAVDVASQYNNNLMRPNLTERTFTTEREDADGTENAAGEYTRFILSEKYMTWRKEGSSLTTYDDYFTAGSVPGFYRMHIYDSGTSRNTLGANKAYLRLLSDRIKDPIWATSPAAPGRQNDFDFVGIEGISDFVSPDTRYQDNRTYNLRGQAVEEPLLPGVYIRNGRKIVIK